MNKHTEVAITLYSAILGVILIIFSPLIVWIVKSHFEAASYNRIMHQNVTTWEAMWVELRVTNGQAGAEDSKPERKTK